MSEDLRKVRIAAHSIEQFYNFPSKQDYGQIIKGLKGKIVALLNYQHTLMENYKDLHTIHTKIKRSLIPIIDKGLNYLFGTATESDLNTMCSSISRLTKSQEEIAHVVDENILVITITRVEVSENRQALNKIIGSLRHLDVKLGNITQALEKEVFLSSWTICTIVFTIRFYYSGKKKNNLASKFFYGACTATIEHVLNGTPFTISHYPKMFERFAIRNRESSITVFKITV